MAEQVRPCPFCGSDVDEIDIKDQCRHYQLLRPCLSIIDEWNKRPIEDKQAELIRQLGEALSNAWSEHSNSCKSYEEVGEQGGEIIFGQCDCGADKALSAYLQWKEEQK